MYKQTSTFVNIIPQKNFVKLQHKLKNKFYRIEPKIIFENLQNLNKIKWLNNTKKSSPIIFIGDSNSTSLKELKKQTKNLINIDFQENILKSLLTLYNNKIEPIGLVFDYNSANTNIHAFLREIYINSSLHIFRNLPIIILNYYQKPEKPLLKKIKIIAINGSPNQLGNTKNLLQQEIAKHWTGQFYESKIIDLKPTLIGCIACGHHQAKCQPICRIKDQITELLPELLECDILMIGSPVYEDNPTSQTNAFLSRIMGITKFNRFAYINKYGMALSSAYCSGTKSVIKSINNALEMMGFTILGRSSREYVELWADNKIRGGVPENYNWPI